MGPGTRAVVHRQGHAGRRINSAGGATDVVPPLPVGLLELVPHHVFVGLSNAGKQRPAPNLTAITAKQRYPAESRPDSCGIAAQVQGQVSELEVADDESVIGAGDVEAFGCFVSEDEVDEAHAADNRSFPASAIDKTIESELDR